MADDYKPCIRREKLVVFRKDGTKDSVRKCAEPSAEAFQQEVTPEICAACPIRQHVQKKVKAEKAKPLKVHQLFRIEKLEKHKPVTRDWLPCEFRETAYVKSCCNSTSKVIRCANAEAPSFGLEVVPIMCSECPVRSVGASKK